MDMRRVALPIVAGAMALAIAWIDTRPTWDDTGISATVVVVASGLAAFADLPVPLAAALGVGPLLLAHWGHWNDGLVLAPLLAFVGAFVGSRIRRTARPGTA
jgi:hypothetical protein